ncbi:metallophosphoesterase [Mariniplasma anaerobium]|uniref:Phosphohydrolase n=1 Tax=Mariniplasma anaerobium TaxID=2735436 RepID=A0A7U9TGM9_9MOLU|nr:metallophosphoesterase [Mariniplasma anaerobium]BCR35808.1 phosphohydrolase [Mariniplasma anaerobium]
MKKTYLFFIFFLFAISISACTQQQDILWTDNDAFNLEVSSDTIKILQITDLHLAFGISNRDQMTYDLIANLAASDDYDLIVITGDMMMSPHAPSLFRGLIKHMESLEIPWTFVFGNHDNDFNDYSELLDQIQDTNYLYFKNGPEMTDGGIGNFKINFIYQDQIIYHAYFLDSKAEREIYTEEEGEYGYLSTAQVAWYENNVSTDLVESVVFMHIPLRQFIDPTTYDGVFLEDKVYAQGIDTGFFDAMVLNDKSKAVFVGHDHLNDFSFIKDDVLLAYGRISGYTSYGYLERGGRHIEIKDQVLTTYVKLESEVSS